MSDGWLWAATVDYGGADHLARYTAGSRTRFFNICSKALRFAEYWSGPIPQRAFEAYVKGVQINERDPKRANYLKNALRLYEDASGGAVYPQAAFELGRFYMLDGKWKESTEYFSRLQKKDPHYAEAAFYASLGYAKIGDSTARWPPWFRFHPNYLD